MNESGLLILRRLNAGVPGSWYTSVYLRGERKTHNQTATELDSFGSQILGQSVYHERCTKLCCLFLSTMHSPFMARNFPLEKRWKRVKGCAPSRIIRGKFLLEGETWPDLNPRSIHARMGMDPEA